MQLFSNAFLAGLSLLLVVESRSFAMDNPLNVDVPPNEEFYTTATDSASKDEQKKADSIRLKTIGSIEALLGQTTAKNPRLFELYTRLAELHAERHDYLRDIEIANFAKEHDRWLEKNSKSKEPVPSYKDSRASLTKSVNSYREIVRKFPKHPRTDEALYALAKTLARLGNANAELYFRQLLDNYKTSRLIPDARIALGDYYFDKHQMTKAAEEFKAAMTYREHKFYPYAIFKLAWSYYNFPAKTPQAEESNLQKSLLAFKLVVHVASKDSQRFAGRIDLRNESVKDLIMVYADLGDTESAWTYFKEIDEEKSFFDLLERFGVQLADKGKDVDAIGVYQRLLKEAPTRPRNPGVFSHLLVLYERSGKPENVITTLGEFKSQVMPKGSWRNSQDSKSTEIAKAEERLLTEMYRYGTLFHNNGLKTKRPFLLKGAESIYTMLLNTFPAAEQAYEVRYYAADLQFESGRYVDATKNYLAVSKAQPVKGKFTKDAALNAVISSNKLDQKSKPPKLPARGKATESVALTESKLLLISAIDNYIVILPNDKQTIGLATEAADAYFNFGHYPEAVKRYEWILDNGPKTDFATHAAKTILGLKMEQKKYSDAVAWAETFPKRTAHSHAPTRAAVTSVYKDAVYLSAMTAESNKQNLEAAKGFTRFFALFPKDKNADKALYNATVNYFTHGSIDQAIKSSETFLSTFKVSPHRANILADLGTTHEGLGDYEKASDYFEMFGKEFPNDNRTPNAIFNSAILHAGLKKPQQAIKNYKWFTRSFPNHELANEARFRSAVIQTELKNYDQAIALYTAYEKFGKDSPLDRKLLSEARIVEIRALLNPVRNGRTGLVSLRSKLTQKNGPNALEARRIVADIMFQNAETSFGNFKKQTIESSREITKAATNQQKKLEGLVEVYEQVMSIGSPEYVVASLYRLGQLHEAFYNQLFKVRPAAGLSEKEVFTFRSEIEKAAFPLKDQAYNYYESAFKRSQEVETFTNWTRQTYAKMAELAPSKHKRLRAKWMRPDYISIDLFQQSSLLNVMR